MGQELGYKYDVFISYQDDPNHLKSVRDMFLRHFKWYLSNSRLGRVPDIYFDKEVNQPGDRWECVIKNALARSRILIPICSIPYFHSEWCRKECAVMLHREKRLGYVKQKRPGSLIVPVAYADGNSYPEVIKKIQHFEYWEYTSARRGSSREAKLEREMKVWVEDIAVRIDKAPTWDAQWLSKAWLEKPITRYEQRRLLWPPKAREHLDGMGWTDG